MDALCDHALFNFSVQDEELMDNIEMVQTILQSAPCNAEDQSLVFDAINVVEGYILATPHMKAKYAYLLPSVQQLKQELSYYMAGLLEGTYDGPVITDDEQDSMSPSSLIEPILADEEIATTIKAPPVKPPVIRCNVCWGEESYANDAIVICDDCNVSVHQTCYGIERIPDASWFCNFCSAQQVAPVETWEPSGECSACHLKGGALIPLHTAHKWVHMSCAIYLPELNFAHGKVDGVDRLKTRRKLKCVFCKTSNQGACAQCSNAKCTSSYHVPCALEHGVTFRASTNSIYHNVCPSHGLDLALKARNPSVQVVPPQSPVQTIQRENTSDAGTTAKIQKSIQMWLSEPLSAKAAKDTTVLPLSSEPSAPLAAISLQTAPAPKLPKTKLKKVQYSTTKWPSSTPHAEPVAPPSITPTKLKSIPATPSPFRPSRLAQVFVPATTCASSENDLVLVILPQLPLGIDFSYVESGPLTIKDVSNPLLRAALDDGLLQKGAELVAINDISLKGITLTQLTDEILPQCRASASVQCWFRKARSTSQPAEDVEWPWGYLRSDGKLAMVLVWQEMGDLYYSLAAAKPAMAQFQAFFRDKSPWTVPSLGSSVPGVVRRHRRALVKELTAIPLPPLEEGDMVQVAARTWPGINKLGGAGRIKAKHATSTEGVYLYDIAYILGGGEKGVEREYITPVTADNPVHIAPSDLNDDNDERWTLYAECTLPTTNYARPSACSAGFRLKFQELVEEGDEDNARLDEMTDSVTIKATPCYRSIVVTCIEGEDDAWIGEDEILKDLTACQAKLKHVESVAQNTLTVAMDKLAAEKKQAYRNKLDRVLATQYENMYRAMVQLEDEDSEDDRSEDAAQTDETVEPTEDDDEPLNPLFASISETATETCVMCCVSGGDLAATSCGNKAHIMCLLYTPETYFENNLGYGIANVAPERARLVCDLCKKATGMNKVQCHSKKCSKAMHVQCAYVAGLLTTHPTFCGWCAKHFKRTDAATQASVDVPPHLQTKRRLDDQVAPTMALPRPKKLLTAAHPSAPPPVESMRVVLSAQPPPAKQPRHITEGGLQQDRFPAPDAQEFDVGDTVDVVPRLWSGMNKPGGVGRVKAKHVDANQVWTYDIDYVLGSREKGVPGGYVSRYRAELTASQSAAPKKKRRRSTLSTPK
ncbi:hypothetical protein H310_12681 [Aphanomyces invadans]|uniref:PHD-type domain-containing protein n=1 Tax=Aphanomyces invadans TaxID=157072 RepID=A0A024TGF3_9STRA|nr:hypothetical protein H310_12681 [Aphanomyces invadans]ETV93240.1 hypothetical protein H310_12681 [Aphanomyces invadans]|eukprot:XP_008878075.1 hypothetical protein H310_12681 [Aphanomyces invadans]